MRIWTVFLFSYYSFLGIPICVLSPYYGVTANEITEGDNNFSIAGYLPDYRINSYMNQQLNNEKMIRGNNDIKSTSSSIISTTPMTDLIMFSLQPHSKGFFGCCLQNDHYNLVEKFVNNTSPINVWVTIGGGGRSDAFPEISSNKALRKKLIRSILNLSVKHLFIKGIDLDLFNPRSLEERDNYVLFLTEGIPLWHKEGLKVSITLRPHHGKLIPPTLYQLLDRIHLMAYDMISSSNDGISSNYHANIDKVRHAIEELLQPGIGLEKTPQKVLLGIPIYCRHQLDFSQVKTFGEIYDEIRIDNNGNNNPKDEKTNKFLRGDRDSSMHSWNGYEWESPARIQNKTILAKEKGLGGIFFWELGQDKFIDEHPNGILFEAASLAESSLSSSSYREKAADEPIIEL